jgi:hypothetical protein
LAVKVGWLVCRQTPSVAVALWSSNAAVVVWVPAAPSSQTVPLKQVAVVRTTILRSTQDACDYFLANDDDDDGCPVPAQVDVWLVWMGLVAWAGLFWFLGNGCEEQHQGPIVVAAAPVVVVRRRRGRSSDGGECSGSFKKSQNTVRPEHVCIVANAPSQSRFLERSIG